MTRNNTQKEKTDYYNMSRGDQLKVMRAALKLWRDRNPDKLPVRSVHDSWYGWVLIQYNTVKERHIVAKVMEDCIIPYLRETSDE